MAQEHDFNLAMGAGNDLAYLNFVNVSNNMTADMSDGDSDYLSVVNSRALAAFFYGGNNLDDTLVLARNVFGSLTIDGFVNF